MALPYVLLALLALLLGLASAQADAPALFRQYCAQCHGAERLGGMGPALLPENLRRLSRDKAFEVVARGRAASQMPAFAERLAPRQIRSLIDYIYSPPATPARWDDEQIRASHVLYKPESVAADASAEKPVYSADPLNLFLVVEAGDHHITVLDGDRLEPIKRFKTRYALHGGPKYSSDGRFVYLASRDGWISKFDMYRLETVAEIRAGINTRNAAVSADDRYVLVGNYLPHTLVLLDARDLSLIKRIEVVDDFGRSSRVSAVYTAAPRNSFVVALKDLKEVWEIGYAEDAEPVYHGLVHDYRMGEGLSVRERFPIRRIHVQDYLDDFFFDPSYRYLIGAARDSAKGQVLNLIVGRTIADVDLHGLPHLGSGISWNYRDTTVLATPNLKQGVVSIIDLKDWSTIRKISTLGPGFFMRSHENSPYAWVDVFFGPHRDAVHVIDKQSLKIIKTLRPAPGKVSAHVEFDRYGRYALLSIWDTGGAVVVYDSHTLKEIKRIPMNKPVGKYNVYNKITRSAGTSH